MDGHAIAAGALIAAYDAMGPHRTARDGDEAHASWLAERAARPGVAVSIEDVPIPRLDPAAAAITCDGIVTQGTPLFDAPASGTPGIAGRIGPAGTDAPIGLLTLSPLAVYDPAFRDLRRHAPHRALVIVTEGGEPGLALLNAEHFLAPFGPPVLQVPSEAGPRLRAAAAAGATATVIADSTRTPAVLRNVVARIGGGEPALVTMTPRSGWGHCASERGGGLACWMAVLAALAADPPPGGALMVASSGHELGHCGLDDFLARRPGLERRATWLHFGANIGAAGGTLSLVSPQPDLRDRAVAAMAAAGQAARLAPAAQRPQGESRAIHDAAGRYLTLVGTNDRFHLPQDRWPAAVDLPSVARCCAASVAIALGLVTGT